MYEFKITLFEQLQTYCSTNLVRVLGQLLDMNKVVALRQGNY